MWVTIYSIKNSVSKTGLKILCHVTLICTIYFITDMICTVACQEIEVVRFLGSFHHCLFLNYDNQTTKQFIKKLLSNSEYGISKTKDKFLATSVIIFFIKKRVVLTLTPWFQVVAKGQTYSQKLLLILSMYDLLLPPWMRV